MEPLKWISLVIFMVCLAVLGVQSSPNQLNMSRYEDSQLPRGQYQRIVVEKASGNVFVGGRNVLKKFNANLTFLQGVSTGPVKSGKMCSPIPTQCTSATWMDNDASVLTLYPSTHQAHLALFCGTANQGLCTVFSTKNLDSSQKLNASSETNLIGNSKSAVAFFGEGRGSFFERKRVLYVGVSYDGRPLNYASKAVSARELKDIGPFDITYRYKIGNRTSAVDIDPYIKRKYIVKYVYGFEHQGFSYFLTVQKSDPHSNTYVSRLVRVCQGDPVFQSYTELQLDCRKAEYQPTFYRIAQAAFLGKPGDALKAKFNLPDDEDILYIAFGRNTDPMMGDVPAPGQGSGICIYPMSKIRRHFTQAQLECYRGQGELLPWIVYHADINHTCKVNFKSVEDMDDNFCGSRENNAIGARYPLETVANVTTDYLITTMGVLVYRDRTVAVLGTSNGTVLKVLINGSKNTAPYVTIPVGSGSDNPVRDMAFDPKNESVYVLTGNRVTRVPVNSCRVHTDCAMCVTSNDPLECGWCKDHCSTVQDCNFKGHFKRNGCPPVIYSFKPLSGPLQGGTTMTILGDRFGLLNGTSGTAYVKVVREDCRIRSHNWTQIVCITPRTEARMDGDIVVTVYDPHSRSYEINGEARSDGNDEFDYVDPHITSFNPRRGPMSGGTRLTIQGTYLNSGSSRKISIGHMNCPIVSCNEGQIVCITSTWKAEFDDRYGVRRRRTAQFGGKVKLELDNAILYPPNDSYFEYKEDPVIKKVSPRTSILSGGLEVNVTGRNLNMVERPVMRASVTGHSEVHYEGLCTANEEGTTMVCHTPAINKNHGAYPNGWISVDVDFLMDKVPDLNDHFTYYLDPLFKNFHNNLRTFYIDEKNLHIWGSDLNHMDLSRSIRITIGHKVCNLTQIGADVVLCAPVKPEKLDLDGKLQPVKVTVGHLTFDIGNLQFAIRPNNNALVRYVLPILCVLLLLGILVAIFLYMRYKHCGPFKAKTMSSKPVRYSPGDQIDVGGPSRERIYRMNGTVDDTRSVHENPYWFNGGNGNITASQITTPEPIIDDEARRLIDDANLLISRDHLLLLEVIGQGHFGCVYRGFMKMDGSKEETEVAVKTLKSLTVGATPLPSLADHAHAQAYTSSVEGRKFLEEALRMREFDHPHILRLKGIALDKEDMPLVVLPFMKHGDLLSYIRNENNSPTVKELMDFGIQISEGMAYLANLKFVHRDLAARNCMLDDSMNVKVADFGLSRDIYERDYYSSDDRKAKLPVKWMAPESLEKGHYNTKTDVWSYGVVLWELMTRGVCPYPEVDNWDIIKFLKENRRMPQPSYCPDALYSIMLQCWETEPKLRPSFEELVRDVKSIIISMEMAHEKVGLNVTYVNVPTSQTYLYPQNHEPGLYRPSPDNALVPLYPRVSTISNGTSRVPQVTYPTNTASRSTLV